MYLTDEIQMPFDVLDYLPSGVLICDRDSNYLYVNQAYCSFNQKSPDFFKGMSIRRLQEMGYLTSNVWEKVVLEKRVVTTIISITNITAGSTYDTFTTGIPVFDADGEVSRIIILQEPLDYLQMRLQKGFLNQLLVVQDQNSTIISEDIIAKSPQMRSLLSLLDIVSKTNASVLITGESGTGKEVLASHIHQSSSRSSMPLVALNCATVPDTLIESELFGYEKGAFSGALSSGKPGLIESADGGTLFLDEINSMPMPVQTKLLRVLETRQVTRLGAVKPKTIDFRLICAANEDLQAMIREKQFRPDLYYRINVVSVAVPALKDRKEDILPLAEHFMHRFCTQYGRVKVLTQYAADQLLAYSWPGNVRELRNVLERTIITSPKEEIQIENIPELSAPERLPDGSVPALSSAAPEPFAPPLLPEDLSYRSYMDQCEKQLLIRTLKACGSPAAAAKALRLDISNIYRKIRKHGISVEKHYN